MTQTRMVRDAESMTTGLPLASTGGVLDPTPSLPSRPDPRIGILTQMDAWSASTRHRALQHVPRLRTRFHSVEISMPGDTLTRHPGRVGQVRYFGAHAVRYTARGLTVGRFARRQDALLIQRGLYPIGPGALISALRGYDGRIVLDLDDAVFEVRPSLRERPAPVQWLYGPAQTLALLRRADEIVVSTPALAEMLPDHCPTPTVLPTVPDLEQYPRGGLRAEASPVVGWAGTVGGLGYLDPLAGVFARLAREGVADLEVVSSRPWPAMPSRFHRWRADEDTALFARFDIGIMPLPDAPYTRAKAGFKLLQYMAAGLPVVASPIGVNSDLVRESGAGYLADSPEEWEEALRLLAGDPELRRSLGAAGREFVERYADLDAQARILGDLLAGR
jgi:glycosyltransferase involved in cell wall biosynthesis